MFRILKEYFQRYDFKTERQSKPQIYGFANPFKTRF